MVGGGGGGGMAWAEEMEGRAGVERGGGRGEGGRAGRMTGDRGGTRGVDEDRRGGEAEERWMTESWGKAGG